jgi:hypothetical protein
MSVITLMPDFAVGLQWIVVLRKCCITHTGIFSSESFRSSPSFIGLYIIDFVVLFLYIFGTSIFKELHTSN